LSGKKLPRLAANKESWVVRASGELERIEVSFSGLAYAPHRHDTYTVGINIKGLQTFDYR
jgi:hypothetical protein